jgi:hypothetical protein
MKYMQLPQGDEADDVQTLRPGFDGFYTGAMSYCVCVIVLWDFNPAAGHFGKMRGMHGAGGVGAVVWEALLAGVPNSPKTKVIAIGPLLGVGSDRDAGKFTEEMHKSLPAAQTEMHAFAYGIVRQDGVADVYKDKPPEVANDPKCAVMF